MIDNLFALETPFFELIIRAVIVYIFLFVILRVSGKRELGDMSAMELVSIMILGDALQNSMIGKDTSLGGGLIIVSVLIGLSNLNAYLSFRFKGYRKVAEGDPTLLVRDGKLMRKNMKKERITEDDLLSLIRGKGLEELSQVKFAIMEASGTLSVISKDGKMNDD